MCLEILAVSIIFRMTNKAIFVLEMFWSESNADSLQKAMLANMGQCHLSR